MVFVKLFKSFFDNDPQFDDNNGFITDDQSTPPLWAAIFHFMIFIDCSTYVYMLWKLRNVKMVIERERNRSKPSDSRCKH